MKLFPIMVVLLTMSIPAFAQESPAEQVQVSNVKDPELQPYRHMLRGLDVWDEQHARLAPQASLRFELWTRDGKMANAEGLQLRLAGNAVDIALPLDQDATFVLPRSEEALADNADLLMNRKKDQFRWRPRIRTPGVPANARRLGDLRLECEVRAAVRKEEIPLLYRAGAVAAGGICKLPMTAYLYRAPQRLLSAVVVSGERKSGLPLREDGHVFQPPLRDTSWDNDALVVYTFAEPAPAATP